MPWASIKRQTPTPIWPTRWGSHGWRTSRGRHQAFMHLIVQAICGAWLFKRIRRFFLVCKNLGIEVQEWNWWQILVLPDDSLRYVSLWYIYIHLNVVRYEYHMVWLLSQKAELSKSEQNFGNVYPLPPLTISPQSHPGSMSGPEWWFSVVVITYIDHFNKDVFEACQTAFHYFSG